MIVNGSHNLRNIQILEKSRNILYLPLIGISLRHNGRSLRARQRNLIHINDLTFTENNFVSQNHILS
jgi:hypothetical protein